MAEPFMTVSRKVASQTLVVLPSVAVLASGAEASSPEPDHRDGRYSTIVDAS